MATATDQRKMLRHGGLAYRLRADSWLTPAQARYALKRFWALVAGDVDHANGSEAMIEIEACSAHAPWRLLELRPGELAELSPQMLSPPGLAPLESAHLPLFFPLSNDANHAPWQTAPDGMVRFQTDLIALTYFLLTRWEETVVDAEDAHGRFPATASVLAKHGLLERPILDEWAAVVRKWIATLWPGWQPAERNFRIHLTCDVDHPLAYRGAWDIVRRSGAALIKRHDLREAMNHAAHGSAALVNWRCDPNFRGLQWLLDLAERHSLQASCYFMSAPKTAADEGYPIDRTPYSQIMRDVIDRGHEVGFHAGYTTHLDAAEFGRQKRRLEQALGRSVTGGRQHYLRFRAPETWNLWESAGMRYDSTVGFAAAVGFRCGTSRPFPVFDSRGERELNLVERPLIAMDVTLTDYLHCQTSDAVRTLVRIGEQCRRHQGEFTILVHNDASPATRHVFEQAVGQLTVNEVDPASGKSRTSKRLIPRQKGAVDP